MFPVQTCEDINTQIDNFNESTKQNHMNERSQEVINK